MISEVMPTSHSIPSITTYARFSPDFEMRVQGSGLKIEISHVRATGHRTRITCTQVQANPTSMPSVNTYARFSPDFEIPGFPR